METTVSFADSPATASPNQAEVPGVHGEVSSRASIFILVTATLAMLLPFLDKPFHIDDPLFVWAAKHIRGNLREGRNPGDFFGFDVNWNGRVQKMHEVTQNPPLACYALAAASYIVGWDERGLHAFFLLPAIGTVLGTWVLARRMCDRPVFAGLVVVTSPVFIVSSTNVMCDTLMTCLWIWAIVLWLAGLDRSSHWRLALAAVLIALAALTKYFALCLIPLLALYTLTRSYRFWPYLFWLLVPVVCMYGYNAWTKEIYGHGMLSGAAEYAKAYYRHKSTQQWTVKPVATFAFTGGCMLCLLFLLPSVLQKLRWAVVGLGIALSVAAWLQHRDFQYLRPDLVRPTSWDLALQAGILDVLGLAVCGLILSELHRGWREFRGAGGIFSGNESLANSLLLSAWVAGTMLFTGYVNWTVNGRSVLPLIPAAAILLSRQMDWVWRQMSSRRRGGSPFLGFLNQAAHALFRGPPSATQSLLLVPAAVLTLLISQADYILAWNQRKAAEEISMVAANLAAAAKGAGNPNPPQLWYAGHWGYQYYMEQAGVGQPIAYLGPPLKKGDLYALPKENTIHSTPSPTDAEMQTFPYKYNASPWVATHCRERRAGFYADRWGPLPFVFGDEWQSDPKLEAMTIDIHKDVHYLLVILHDLQTDGLLKEDETEAK